MSEQTSKPNVSPLNEQVKELLQQRIQSGEYPALSQLPSENELSELFSVSRITIRQALHKLSLEGLIFKVHGKGTFVSKPKAYQNITQLQGFAEAMSSTGHHILNEVLSIDFIEAPLKVASKLKLAVRSQVTEIKRVRLLNNEPVSYELTYLPQEIGLKLLEKQVDLRISDIFTVIEKELDIPLGYADLNIDAIQADDELAQLLSLDINTPILRVERLTHDANKHPIDYEYLYFSGESFQYQLRIFR
ncbi:GntR family transcriptional regulator [Acinetobacter gerneri]|jgi:GntR family transcriptional regulator|uniref:GntR family transcriptional regulator n=1 Tax=Acinetobacter gerneri TaxID=202952 RepID=A0AAW8JM21_9GAMM|nr:GntR family transcriptional regulator [Acinetobacter gerneri]MCH4244986.1 GntR family transcriptional regulator [Acinetobacter gerneri]MDQ9010633.1 GntR family transcriptional regulator [Acinetobacter gerneri]MDQ9014832.1 GntR family transcriptional regulator [Acinetobacter gerneri]MDQ9026003.1 GntR family transcriptional regulator [Acinetobacter gerneri]MDQ9053245.1 GntR family transcriptional regulator [Acinetobacter gerneri]